MAMTDPKFFFRRCLETNKAFHQCLVLAYCPAAGSVALEALKQISAVSAGYGSFLTDLLKYKPAISFPNSIRGMLSRDHCGRRTGVVFWTGPG